MLIKIYVHFINGKPYIGQSTNYSKRCHISSYKNSKKVYDAMKKYGCDFSKSLVLAETDDAIEANLLEAKYIQEYDSVNNGWNSYQKETRINRGSNTRFSEEHKKHLSEAMKGNKNQRPRKQTEETKKKLSAIRKEYYKTNTHWRKKTKTISNQAEEVQLSTQKAQRLDGEKDNR